ncbi:MAG: hypothetical protein RQ743_04945 [Bacteroidales bacterium]|nr:hypothetical protein [Bacteroidales bacterium]
MKKTYTTNLAGLILIIALAMAGCAKKLSSSTSGEANLVYGFTGNESFSYMQSSKMIQTIVYMGQEVNTSVNTNMGFTTAGKGIASGKLILENTVDTLGMTVNSMGANMKEDISSLKGKSFMMTMNTNGSDKDLKEAKNLTYSIAGLQTSNLESSFITIFPSLPDGNVRIGYTWQATDTVTVNTETENAELIIITNNTVEAREKVEGYDCYKISYQVSGTRDGSSQTPQGLVVTNADVSGTGYYYFAVKEGIIVSDHSEIKTDGDVVIPTGESIPMYMTATTDLKLL